MSVLVEGGLVEELGVVEEAAGACEGGVGEAVGHAPWEGLVSHAHKLPGRLSNRPRATTIHSVSMESPPTTRPMTKRFNFRRSRGTLKTPLAPNASHIAQVSVRSLRAESAGPRRREDFHFSFPL